MGYPVRLAAMPLRKDAARNREQIVAVARELVAEGAALPLNDIARRTGLGVGTVYRHFPTAEALLETVATPSLEALADQGRRALIDRDYGRSLRDFLLHVIEAQVTDASVSPVMAAATDTLEHTTELKHTLWSTATALVDRAVGTGVARPDLMPDDITPLMCGLAFAAQVHSGPGAGRKATARRYLTMMLEGLFVVTGT
jgi:AcrR family transcriptional regulator